MNSLVNGMAMLNQFSKLLRNKVILKLVLIFFVLTSVHIYATTPTIISDEALEQQQKKLAQLQAFVDSGIAYIKKYGTKKAYQEFSKTNGKFRQGQMYIFVYNYNGINLAHGDDPKNFVGKNKLDYRDQYGTPVVILLTKIAKRGGGFLHYYWRNSQTNQLEYKTAYVKPIDNNTFIGSGIYENIATPQTQDIRIEELKSFVHEAIAYYKQYGEKAAFKEFDNTSGKFKRGNLIVFVGNFQGICVASSDPSLIGRNDLDTTDAFGTPFVKMFIEAANNGGGVITYYWTNYQTKKNEIKIVYVEKLSDEYLIGAGNY